MKPVPYLLFWIALAAACIGPVSAFSQVLPFENGREEVYFRFHFPPQGLDSIGRMVSIDAVIQDSVYAYASKEAFTAFLGLGLPHQVLMTPSMMDGPWPMSGDASEKGILSWDYYPTYQGYETLMTGFEQQYPSLCRMHNLGVLTSGRRILALHISNNPDSLQAKPAFLYSSSMHGDELTGYILLLRLADYLLSNYGIDPLVTRLVDSLDIWISPLANPDGTYRGGNHTVSFASRYNAANVDLNRNYPDAQYGPHPDNKPWQQETQIYMNFAQTRKFSLGANIHGGAEVCNYPWDIWSRLHPDNNWWIHVCRQYVDTVHSYSPSNYMSGFNNGITNGYAWYSISGGRQDYMNYVHQCREFTLEISNTKLPSPSTLNYYWNYNYRSLLRYMEQGLFGLHGSIYDSLSGQPIQAKVFIPNHDQDSSWVFSRMPHGDYHRYLPSDTYNIVFSAPGYEDKIFTAVGIANGQPTFLDVPLLKSGLYISGSLTYNNAAHSIIDSAIVFLKDSLNQVLDSVHLRNDGTFYFDGLQQGYYRLSAKPLLPWGGVNSADALAIMRHFVQLDTIHDALALKAADVNASDFVNASDALHVQKRFVNLIASFMREDWLSDDDLFYLSANRQIMLRVQCTGDADASYAP